ncbi:MAG: phosphoglycerate dehydrogenase [Armatimonadota bacterium]
MKVLITATSFSEITKEPEQRLVDAGYEIAHNPYGRPMTAAEVAPLLKGVDAVAAGVDDFSAPALSQADQLKAIVKHGAGVDNIAIEECTRRGIIVANIPGANAEAVADMTLALMLAVARHIPEGDRTTKAGHWVNTYGVDLFRATVGLLGMGRIGKGVARRCRGFDADVLAYDPYFDEEFSREYRIGRADSIEQVMREADFVCVHMPSNEQTRKIINAKMIALMKPTAILVNTARGAIVDEEALADALEEGRIFGAGLDVYATEPPTNRRLIESPRTVTMPHVSSNTPGALLAMGNGVVDAIMAVFAGKRPESVVNPEVYR